MDKTTSNTFLYHSATATGTFTKLIDITSYPSPNNPPEKLDRSDLSSNQKKYVQGMEDAGDLEFGFNYDKTSYNKVKALESGAVGYYQLRFGANGEYGAWQWSGTHFASIDGAGVGETRKGKLTCYAESDITPVTIEAK